MNARPPRVLVLLAHPAFERSRVHRALAAAASALPEVRVHDLYEHYPDFDVDVRAEQALLASHDIIVLQHPFYWYSVPALMKQWIDLVLEHGWAYGSTGSALVGKLLLSAVSTGGGQPAYRAEGTNRRTVREFLAPMEATARLCGMRWLPPFVVHGTHRLDEVAIQDEAARYARTLRAIDAGAFVFERAAAGHELTDASLGTG